MTKNVSVPQVLVGQIARRALVGDYQIAKNNLEALRPHLETVKQKNLVEDLEDALDRKSNKDIGSLVDKLAFTFEN